MRRLALLSLVLTACPAVCGTPPRFQWHIGNFQRVNELRAIVTYYNNSGEIMVCNEAHTDGFHSVADSVSCVLLPPAPTAPPAKR